MKYYMFSKTSTDAYAAMYEVSKPTRDTFGKYVVGDRKLVKDSMIAKSSYTLSSEDIKKEVLGKTTYTQDRLGARRTHKNFDVDLTISTDMLGITTIKTEKLQTLSSIVNNNFSALIKMEVEDAVKYAQNTFDNIGKNEICYIGSKTVKDKGQKLLLYSHRPGTNMIKLVRKTAIYRGSGNNKEVSIITNEIKLDSKGKVSSACINEIYNEFVKASFTKYSDAKIYKTYYDMSLTFVESQLAGAGEWEIGSFEGSMDNIYGISDVKRQYCFYCEKCSGEIEGGRLKYFYGSGGLPCYVPADKNLVHLQSTHGITYVGSSSSTESSSQKYYGSLDYTIKGDASKATGGKNVSKLKFGTSGTYKDGVAPTPFVMIELRGKDDDNFPPYNLSVPADSLVSLTHERNLHDSYNTFSLQLFDKNAMKVEAYLLLGYRYIRFYYTDFVSTSKRFKGEILNYQTVIAGKGLMLTLDGYTTNTDIYTGKDSIPWSYFFDVKDIAFFYWLNDAGEDHGIIRAEVSENGGAAEVLNNYKNATYRNDKGSPLPAMLIRESYPDMYKWMTVGYDTYKEDQCHLKIAVSDGNKTTLETYDEYYNKLGVDPDIISKYRPKPAIFSLESYNPNIANEIKYYEKETLGSSVQTILQEKRISNVVMLICIINNWKWNPRYITETTLVSEIPDQVAKSYTQYIKEDLIPKSVSANGNATNFDFWFDNEGCAHFGPGTASKSNKSLYFNSIERKDSYPLIGFTAATNGAVLMQTDATQLLEAMNIYTGDALDQSTSLGVKDADGKIRQNNTTVHKSEEWYTTNRIVNKDSNTRLVTYSNMSGVESSDNLKSELVYRYGKVAKYSYKARLDVYGCSDIEPGTSVDVYIYIDDGKRSDDPVTTDNGAIVESIDTGYSSTFKIVEDYKTRYRGNTTMHHTSGRYFVNKITDTISAGKYQSSLEVLKVDDGQLSAVVSDTVYDVITQGKDNGLTGSVIDGKDVDVEVRACYWEDYDKLNSGSSGGGTR